VPTQDQVLAAAGDGLDYDRAAKQLRIPPGQAYLVATGRPAGGGDTFPPDHLHRRGVIEGSAQHRVYPDADKADPAQRSDVHGWIRHRAGSDHQLATAARRRDAAGRSRSSWMTPRCPTS
jgi:hypothetical protein